MTPNTSDTFPVGIGQQWVVEALRVGETRLLVYGVGADPHPGCPECGELLGQVSEVGFLLLFFALLRLRFRWATLRDARAAMEAA